MSIVSLAQHLQSHRRNAPGVANAPSADLVVAAEQFEALFLQQILKQMRKAGDVLAADNPMRSRELDTMRDFYDEILAETLAGQKQTGIADLLVRQLSGNGSQDLDLQQAAEMARSAELPARSSSLSEPLRNTWQRGLEGLGSTLQRGAAGFTTLVERVIRQESGGRVDAVSPKGARGLMQLMPDTARDMARELGLPFSEARLTSDADYNRQLGSAYLDRMLVRYDGEPALALAAYNAGPGKVDEWLKSNGDPRTGEISVRAWIERIPYRETRDYASQILGDLSAARAPAATSPLSVAAPLSTSLSPQTRSQVQAAASARHGLLLGSAAGKQPFGNEPVEQPAVSAAARTPEFKSSGDSVVLLQQAARSAGESIHQSRSAAFAQVIRIGRKETES